MNVMRDVMWDVMTDNSLWVYLVICLQAQRRVSAMWIEWDEALASFLAWQSLTNQADPDESKLPIENCSVKNIKRTWQTVGSGHLKRKFSPKAKSPNLISCPVKTPCLLRGGNVYWYKSVIRGRYQNNVLQDSQNHEEENLSYLKHSANKSCMRLRPQTDM